MPQVSRKPRFRPRPKQIRLIELAARNRDELNQQKRKLEDEAQANQRPMGRFEHENLQEEIEPLEGACDATTSESEALEKRLCEGYRERGFLLDWGLRILERAEELESPDGLALARTLCDFAYKKLNMWHIMALDQVYQADADHQLKAGIREDLHRHGSSTHISLESAEQILNPQQELFARAMRTLRIDHENFVPKLVGPQSYAHLSHEEWQQALFRDLIYFNARDIELARTARNEKFSIALLGLFSALMLLFMLWIVKYG
ncbi:hypothetical protein MMC07_004770 [Pseudocyphellaria aurata]|nr:hypothetical protein [Pseudocyphellaria aurata]